MAKITKRTVDAAIASAVAKGKQVTVTDSTCPGLYLRASKTGKAHWYFRFRLGKTRERIAMGQHGAAVKSPDHARELAGEYSAAVQRGDDPRAEKQAKVDAPSMAALCDEFLTVAKTYKKSWKKDEQRIDRYIKPELGRIKVQNVTRGRVRQLLDEIGEKEGKPGTANKVRALLSRMFNFAIEHEPSYRNDNPCAGLGKSRAKGGAAYPSKDVHRYLQPDEVRALMEAIDEVVTDEIAAAAIRWIMLTGCRHHEALNMRWSDVDAANRSVRLGATKTGDQRRAVSDAAFEVLHDVPRPQVGDAYVFPSPRSPKTKRAGLDYWWRKALEKAEIGRCRIHDLRHTAASLAAARGASLPQIGAMLGHTSPQATYIYSHLVNEDVRRVANTVGDAIAAATKAGPKVKPLRPARSSKKRAGAG